jgi:hypothetical protein
VESFSRSTRLRFEHETRNTRVDVSDVDRTVVEGMRARFDPFHGRIAPHATLVFAVDRLDADRLGAHVVERVLGDGVE